MRIPHLRRNFRLCDGHSLVSRTHGRNHHKAVVTSPGQTSRRLCSNLVCYEVGSVCSKLDGAAKANVLVPFGRLLAGRAHLPAYLGRYFREMKLRTPVPGRHAVGSSCEMKSALEIPSIDQRRWRLGPRALGGFRALHSALVWPATWRACGNKNYTTLVIITS